jgi:ADP-ribose pyrophosphatase YjhB (NUDIX family)
VGTIAAGLAAELTGEDAVALAALFAADGGHATPKVDVRGVLFRGHELLLVRGVDDGLWTVPGGWAEIGERPSRAVEKEVRQESGYAVRAVELLAVHDRDVRDRPRWPFHAYKLFFRCELVEEAPAPIDEHETDAVGFFAEDALPPLSERMGSRGAAWLFERLRSPDRAAEFD